MDDKKPNWLHSKKTTIALIAIWIAPLSIGLSLMLGLHMTAQAKEPLRGLASVEEVTVHHFLSLQCTCSKNLIEHLLSRRATAGTHELVHLIHADTSTAQKMQQAGFDVEAVDEETAVQKFNLQSLPQMVITQNGRVLYQGGYGPDQQHRQVYEDEKIIHETTNKQTVSEFPIFGCANGKLRKGAFDILGVKYGFNK